MSSLSLDTVRNVGSSERTISIIGGALLALVALRRAPTALILAALGGFLLYRGASAHCPIYDALGVSTVAEALPPHEDHHVDQAMEDSFPASDPPAWNTGSMFTQVSE